MNVDYALLEQEIEEGTLRQRLTDELVAGFRELARSGERLPLASHYASQIAEIIDRGAPEPLPDTLKFYIYKEVLEACESARATVLGEVDKPQA